jgi:uncharacterized protein (TIGR02996 family)
MSMRDAFLSDIASNPEDDAPRFAYADWLTDNGGPERGQFIRAQCLLEKLGPCDPERWSLEADARDLLEKNGKKWLKDVPKVGARIDWARGFPARFTLPLPKLLEKGAALLDAAPTLREYNPLKYATGWEEFVKSPLLGRLSGLLLGEFSITGGRAAALLQSPQVAGLRFLSIGGAKLGIAGARAFTSTPHLAGLRHLEFNGSEDGGPILERLAASPHFPALTSLELRANNMTAAGVAALARSPTAARLESLIIKEHVGDDAARAFAGGDWRTLRTLTLSLGSVFSEGIEVLAGCTSLSGVRELSLSFGRGDPNAALFTAPHLARLERLVLKGRQAAGPLEALAASPMLANLRGLVVTDGGKDCAKGMEAVLSAPASAGLVELKFSDNYAIDAVAKSFARATHLTNLRRLSLGYGWHHHKPWACDILTAPHLAGVVELDFGVSDIGEPGLRALIACPHLGSLRRLWVAHCNVHSHAGTRKPLEERFGAVLTIE